MKISPLYGSEMREPNFSESQLQQAVNTVFIRRIFEQTGQWAFAHVPSLIAEFDLGWDTAFYLHWLPYAPSADSEGCNFFLQYKLSGELTSRGAKEWPRWRAQYFRFKIPHSTRSSSGQFVDDYHQWQRLKALADMSLPTFYATNATLQKDELQRLFQSGTLLDRVPFMDVRTVAGEHKHVTFTPSSDTFALHSETEVVKKLALADTLGRLADGPQSSFEASAKEVLKTLKELAESDEAWNSDIARIVSPPDHALTRTDEAWVRHALLVSFVRKHLGAELLWLPKLG